MGASARPVFRSHATRLVLWVVRPIAATSDGVAPPAASAEPISRLTVRQMASASCSTRPGAGVADRTGAAVRATRSPSRLNRQTRAVVVPASMASRRSGIGQEDAWVHDPLRIQRRLDRPEQRQALRPELAGEIVAPHPPNAVMVREAAAMAIGRL